MTRRVPFLTAAWFGASALWCAGSLFAAPPAASHTTRPNASPPAQPTTRPAQDPFAGVRRDADVAAALEDLQDADWIIQYRAIRRLAQRRATEAVGPLQKLVASPKARTFVRGRALVALTEIQGPAQLPAALAAARDPAWALRAAAMEALGLLGSPKALPAVRAGLNDKHPPVRQQARIALARLEGAKAWPELAKALTHADSGDIRYAAKALGWVPTKQAGEALIGLLTHEDARVRAEAITSLGRLRPAKALEPLLSRAGGDSDPANRQLAEQALAGYPAPALRKDMLAALGGRDVHRIRPAMRLLAGVADRATADALADLVRQRPKTLRYFHENVLALLGRLDADRYRALFEAGLESSSSSVRREALVGLGRCQGVDFFHVLTPLLADRSNPVRQQALRIALRRTRGSPPGGIAPWVAPALASRDRVTRALAQDLIAQRLKREDVPGAIESLRDVLRGSDSGARGALAAALARRADQPLLRRLAAEQGYLTHWQICGPWPNDKNNAGLHVTYAAERDALAASAPGGQHPPVETHAAPAAPKPADGDAPSLPAATAAWPKLPTDRVYPPLVAADSDLVRPWSPETGGGAGWLLTVPPKAKADRTILAFPLALPAESEATFRAVVQPGNGDQAGPVQLRLLAGAKELARYTIAPDAKQQAIEASLAAWAGREVTLSVIVERPDAKSPGGKPAGDGPTNGSVIFRSPVVRAGATRVADLTRPKPPPLALAGRRARADDDDTGPRWLAADVLRVDGQVHLHDHLPPPSHYQSAIAVADIHSARAREVFLDVKADDSWRAWCNGRPVPPPTTKTPHPAIRLRKGPNRLVLKVTNLREMWLFSVRLVDAQGKAVDPTH